MLLDVHGAGLPGVEEALPVDKGLAFWVACAVVKCQYIASVAANSVRVAANSVRVWLQTVCM